MKYYIIPILLFILSPSFSQVIINEFQAQPTLAGEPEWIEFYNKSSQDFTADTLFISDSKTYKKILKFKVKAKSYLIMTKDTTSFKEAWSSLPQTDLYELSFPSLNNTFDSIVLRNKDSSIIDSVYYSYKWGEKGKSFERIYIDSPAVNFNNLLPCKDPLGATPGRENSVYQDVKIIDDFAVLPNPFCPTCTGIDSKCKIEFKLPFSQAILNVKVFDINGVELRHLINSDLYNQTGYFYWDGKDKYGNILQVGAYILALEAADNNSNEVFGKKLLVVIGEK